MRVVFRADASVEIGTGHIMRCLTLADELKRHGHQCHFICREHKGHLGELITNKGYALSLLSDFKGIESNVNQDEQNAYSQWLGVSWQYDANQTIESLSSERADWLIVDHYALDARWEQKIAPEVDRIMVIDDLADRPHDCNLLLDQNLGRELEDYEGLLQHNTKCLIGPRYALLRPEFSRLREKSLQRRQNPAVKRVLISLGGVDQMNVTGQVLVALSETTLSHDIELDIIMGASTPALTQVQAQAASLPYRATVSVNVDDMAERMCLADLSIGAAGSTSWERCCMGLPVILVVLADNQESGARALEAFGAALAINDPKKIQVVLPLLLEKICKSESLKRMSTAASGITDGKGFIHVVEAMMAIARRTL